MSTKTRLGSTPPRGLLLDGTVRTTGWLMIAGRPVSSGVLAAIAFAFIPFATMAWGDVGFLPLFTAAAGYGMWKLYTTLVCPASRARNLGPCPAYRLAPGQDVRLHGDIGPVTRLVDVSLHPGGQVRVVVSGGRELHWAADRPVQLVRLVN
ncbi:hypothetical protein NLX83_12970 [Allokutzneria sp. A3M-2-11 16]|uniref:hypothetical protein n=1 Tax=Allokutzneria sp. A3M-2-11 16 TaxID=2962043 RepID=UPI0020B8E1AE|nr:hypothetical protein [Allokutzneria sp. A3M-2-11 16]MCP3800171.1 hypothetical protein [Allokutzneria sp. A3M-2-11 16]